LGLYVGSGQSADMPRVAVAWPVSIRRADCAVCGRYVARSSAPDVPTMVPATPPARCVPPPSPAGRGVRIARRLGYGFPMARSYHVFGDIAAKLAVAPNKKSPASAGLVCLVHLPACKLRRSTRCGTITSRPRYTGGTCGIGDPMTGPEEYRRYARECLELAGDLRVPRAPAALHHMAQVWLRLAQDAENRAHSQDEG